MSYANSVVTLRDIPVELREFPREQFLHDATCCYFRLSTIMASVRSTEQLVTEKNIENDCKTKRPKHATRYRYGRARQPGNAAQLWAARQKKIGDEPTGAVSLSVSLTG